VKLEKSPTNKSRFPPIKRADSSVERGGESPFKKYYEDSSLNKRKTAKDSEDSFTKKIISLKRTAPTDFDTPYRENMASATKSAMGIWQKHREKKIMLNRSQEQLQRSVAKWGHQKSFHHERAAMVADRHSIVYNSHARSFKAKTKNPNKKDELSNSLFISQDKFLESDDDSMKSSEEEDESKGKNLVNGDYSFEESAVKNVMSRIHDMSYMTTDHDVSANYSAGLNGPDDSFFLTRKNLDGDLSPKKAEGASPDLRQNAQLNPIQKLNRIQKLRQMKGAIIGANKKLDQENIDTIFNTETSLKRHISLSLYTRPKSLIERRPMGTDYEEESFGTLSLRKNPNERNATVQKYQSNHGTMRTRQIDEIGSLKYKLTAQDINCSVQTIEKAILFPEDRPEEERKYPRMEEMLLKNPFAKKKKKKKGKKKKKK
jgi:hypothetical protein